jgi:rubrerythrin
MEKFKSVDELLNFAISKEQEAAEFYTDLSKQVSSSAMSEVFLSFADEERGHKSKLESIKAGKRGMPAPKKIQDLKVGDYLVDVEATQGMSYQDALILAMKREKASYRLYNDLAEIAETADLRNTMLALAQEEARHKLRFEIEYDEQILEEN